MDALESMLRESLWAAALDDAELDAVARANRTCGRYRSGVTRCVAATRPSIGSA